MVSCSAVLWLCSTDQRRWASTSWGRLGIWTGKEIPDPFRGPRKSGHHALAFRRRHLPVQLAQTPGHRANFA